MTKDEALEIIKEENLVNYSWFGNEVKKNWGILKDMTAIDYTNDRWVTYIIGERDCIMDNTQLYFEFEGEALDDFIRRLRLGKEIMESEIRRKEEVAEKNR